jgi:hypothetical protein
MTMLDLLLHLTATVVLYAQSGVPLLFRICIFGAFAGLHLAAVAWTLRWTVEGLAGTVVALRRLRGRGSEGAA